MKPLILILLAATYAAAQNPTIADIARQERARRGQNATTKVYTTADIKSAAPVAAGPENTDPAATPAPGTTSPAGQLIGTTPAATIPAAGAAPTEAAAPVTPAEDPVQLWLAETEKLRAQLRQLVDQEAATQIEINTITNRVYAPVTSVPERDRAQAELLVAQNKLQGIRDQIAKGRAQLAARELEGPPKK